MWRAGPLLGRCLHFTSSSTVGCLTLNWDSDSHLFISGPTCIFNQHGGPAWRLRWGKCYSGWSREWSMLRMVPRMTAGTCQWQRRLDRRPTKLNQKCRSGTRRLRIRHCGKTQAAIKTVLIQRGAAQFHDCRSTYPASARDRIIGGKNNNKHVHCMWWESCVEFVYSCRFLLGERPGKRSLHKVASLMCVCVFLPPKCW